VTDEDFAVGALPSGIGILEVLADIAEGCGAQKSVAQGVEYYVAIGVRDHAASMRNAHAAEHDEVARSKRVYIGALSNSHDECS
jgi:hypothetical protein